MRVSDCKRHVQARSVIGALRSATVVVTVARTISRARRGVVDLSSALQLVRGFVALRIFLAWAEVRHAIGL